MSDLSFQQAVALLSLRTGLPNAEDLINEQCRLGRLSFIGSRIDHNLRVGMALDWIPDLDPERSKARIHDNRMFARDDIESLGRDLLATAPLADMLPGMPGRPEKGKTAIENELRRRLDAGEALSGVRAEARALIEWYRQQFPLSPSPKLKSTENLIRADFKAPRIRA